MMLGSKHKAANTEASCSAKLQWKQTETLSSIDMND